MDFTAKLYFKTTAEGGRKSFVMNGYRPHIKFDFDEMLTSGQQIYFDKEKVFPGETVLAEITILSVDYFKKKLESGLEFNFFEGSTHIGSGKILEVIK